MLDTISVTAVEGIVGRRDSAINPESTDVDNLKYSTLLANTFHADLDFDSNNFTQSTNVGNSVTSSTPKPLTVKDHTFTSFMTTAAVGERRLRP